MLQLTYVTTYKMLQLTECYNLQNVTTYRMLQLTKCYHLQNVTTYRMLQLTECYNLQNVTTYIMYTLYNKHVQCTCNTESKLYIVEPALFLSIHYTFHNLHCTVYKIHMCTEMLYCLSQGIGVQYTYVK